MTDNSWLLEDGTVSPNAPAMLKIWTAFPECERSRLQSWQLLATERTVFFDSGLSLTEFMPSDLCELILKRLTSQAGADYSVSLVALLMTLPLSNGKERTFNNAISTTVNYLRSHPKLERMILIDPLTGLQSHKSAPTTKKDLVKEFNKRRSVLHIHAANALIQAQLGNWHVFDWLDGESRKRLLRTVGMLEFGLSKHKHLLDNKFAPVRMCIPDNVMAADAVTIDPTLKADLETQTILGGIIFPS